MSTPKVKNIYKNKKLETSHINESEKKRLESLKKKKETFRAKEEAVQNALKNFDNQPNKNKIIFDEDIDNIEVRYSKKDKKKRDLFNNGSDGDGDEVTWNDDDFEIKNELGGKPFAEGVTLGNDERFKLDKRFVEPDEKFGENETLENGESDLQKEKEWQLDILGNVLGKPVAPKMKDSNMVSNPTKKKMIRYDPMENEHKKYEIIPEKSEAVVTKTKKKKLKETTKEIIESTPVVVSKDIYYSVSDSLTKRFNEGGQFSLLSTLKNEENTKQDYEDASTNGCKPIKNQEFKFNFDTKNPFKYDSSDEENHNEEQKNTGSMEYNNAADEERATDRSSTIDQFFFDINDARFNEAATFFSNKSVSGGEFKDLRWELKQIVRSKIRKNQRKNESWGGKRKVRKSF